MIQKIKSENRHFSDFGGLKTYWLFSFSNYYDPNNMQFGALRVFNDDVIMPNNGFPDHPHDTMEIVTIVLDGTLSHTDSMGNTATISKGEVQRMSAGKGIVHSEFNKHDEPVHLYQLWFQPAQATIADYEQKMIDISRVGLVPLVSNTFAETLHINADVTIYELVISPLESIPFDVNSGRGLFIYVTSGSLSINEEVYTSGDQARIQGPMDITFSATENTKAIVIDVIL